MPELPDLEAYRHALRARLVGQPVERVAVTHPFLLRTVAPPVDALEGRRIVDVRRLGKRIVLALEDGLFVVLHLMVAGRLRSRAMRGRRRASRSRASISPRGAWC